MHTTPDRGANTQENAEETSSEALELKIQTGIMRPTTEPSRSLPFQKRAIQRYSSPSNRTGISSVKLQTTTPVEVGLDKGRLELASGD